MVCAHVPLSSEVGLAWLSMPIMVDTLASMNPYVRGDNSPKMDGAVRAILAQHV